MNDAPLMHVFENAAYTAGDSHRFINADRVDRAGSRQNFPKRFSLEIFKDKVWAALLKCVNDFWYTGMIQLTDDRGFTSQSSGGLTAGRELGMRQLDRDDPAGSNINRFEYAGRGASSDERFDFKSLVEKVANVEFAAQAGDVT